MARRDLSNFDASDRAASELQYIIRSEDKSKKSTVPTVTSEQAMRGKRIFHTASNRDVTRVLFVSRNTELLNPTKQTLDGYIDISDLFDEVHILILRHGIPPKNPVLRVADNVWMYTASSDYWWLTPKAGKELAEDQLVFAAGFRPDLIVARDPFESAIVAHMLGKKYNRPTQLHILDDYSTSEFIKKSPHNFSRLFLPVFTIPKFLSVRTLTASILTMVQKKFTVPDVALLPRYQNYESLISSTAYIDLKEKYRPFIFVLLYVGKLGHESTFYRALDAARFVLKNPRVGMVVIGEGPAQGEFEKRAKLLGIERQVVFEKRGADIDTYLKSANMLIVTDVDPESEEIVLRGAAAGIPMVMSQTDARDDIFEQGASAFICEPTNIQDFTDRINDLLNDIPLRETFVKNGQELIREKFHHDPSEYLDAYRTSIEEAMFVEATLAEEEEES